MKQNNYRYLFILGIFSIFLMVLGCVKDDYTEDYSNEDITSPIDQNSFQLKTKRFEQYNGDLRFHNALSKATRIKNGRSGVNGKTVMEDQYGFVIDSTKVNEITFQNITTYTFLIHRDTVNTSIFENLVITLDSTNTPRAYLVKYLLNSEPVFFAEHNAYILDAETVISDIDYNTAQSKISYTGDNGCLFTLTCPYTGGATGEHHPATQACIDEDRGNLYWHQSNCPATENGASNGIPGGGAPSSGDTGTPSGNDGPTSGGGGGGTQNPENPDYDPTDPDVHGNGGQPVLTAPVFEDPEQEEEDCNTSKEDLKKVFPNATDDDMELLASIINDKGQDFGIENDEDLWHFLSQAGHETGGFETLNVTESTYWTTASRLATTYSRFTMDSIEAANNINIYYAPDYLTNSSGVANIAMCCKFGNGSVSSGDGYRYRGRGLFQLTWKDNYQEFKTWYNNKYDPDIDPISSPDIIASNDTLSILSGLWWYKVKVDDQIAVDSITTVDAVTLEINGKAKKGLADRKQKFTTAKDSIKCL